MKVFTAGALYFLTAFAAGFALGPIRVLWAAPRFGERAAELAEMPVMLAVIILAARWIFRRLALPPSAGLGAGLIALGLLLAAEFSFVLRLRDLSLFEYVAGRDPVSGIAYALVLLAFALLPWLLARPRPTTPSLAGARFVPRGRGAGRRERTRPARNMRARMGGRGAAPGR